MRRLILLAIVALALAPGTFVRTPMQGPDLSSILVAKALPFERELEGEITIEGIWHLTSPNEYFGGYSGLVALPDGDLLAVSDKGGWLRFSPPDAERQEQPQFGPFPRAALRDKHAVDAESIAFDPESGQVWVAYEGSNSVERSMPDFVDPAIAEPAEMKNWPGNRGPEAMARLPNGRFIILGETAPGWTGKGFPGLLFDGDPVDGGEAMQFRYLPPDGFRATDLTPLPDGRVLVLMRSVERYFPPRFGAKIALADPTQIEAGEDWSGKVLLTLTASLPRDNFEGLTAIPREEGGYTLWMLSDDNGALFQRTLLYRLYWRHSAEEG